jgi:sugar diacid utilization regulator
LRRIREQFLTLVRQVLAEHNPDGVVVERSAEIVILPHLPTAEPTQAREQARAFVEALARQAQTVGSNVSYAIAGGGFHKGIDGLRRSFREAHQALEIGARLTMRRPIWFDEVQLYLLLEVFTRGEEAREWFARVLGPLLEYDRRNRTQMVQTMEAYFDASQSLQQTALALHVHPNTLKYRLQRIRQVLGQDPFVGENQLQFYLAAKMARLLQ